jgi:hypothetical protein
MKTDGLLSAHFRQDAMRLLTRHIRHIRRLFSENLPKRLGAKSFPTYPADPAVVAAHGHTRQQPR